MMKANELHIGDYVLNEESQSVEQIIGITDMDSFNKNCDEYDYGYNLLVRLFPSGNTWRESENLICGIEVSEKFLTDNKFIYDEMLEVYTFKNSFFEIRFNLISNSLMFRYIFTDADATFVPILQHERFYVHHIQHLFTQLNIIHKFIIENVI